MMATNPDVNLGGEMALFRIRPDGSGDVWIDQLTDEQALADLQEDGDRTVVLEKIEHQDPNYWGENAALFIRGEIVVPKPATVVKEWKF